jgi:hypothetical protein
MVVFAQRYHIAYGTKSQKSSFGVEVAVLAPRIQSIRKVCAYKIQLSIPPYKKYFANEHSLETSRSRCLFCF